MSIWVKICGLKTEAALEAALGAGADAVGFVFFPPSPRHVTWARAEKLFRRARGRAEIVALLVDPDDDLVDDVSRELAPDLLQLHGLESPDRVRSIRRRAGVPVMKAVGIAGPEDLPAARAQVAVADRLLLDAKPTRGVNLPGGNGLAFDWRLLAELDLGMRFVLSGGLDSYNVRRAIRVARPIGVDVSSGVESAPGVKAPEKIAAFVAAARSAASVPGRSSA
jgi:phosphoribosylanthranilate isomerase